MNLGLYKSLHSEDIDTSWMTNEQLKIFNVLLDEENRHKTARGISLLAGFTSNKQWKNSINDDRFLNLLKSMEVRLVITHLNGTDVSWMKPAQYKIFKLLTLEENKNKDFMEICELAGYDKSTWYLYTRKDKRFSDLMESMDIDLRRPTIDSEEIVYVSGKNRKDYLKNDEWDMRKLYKKYSRQSNRNTFIVDFKKIINTSIRNIVKKYFSDKIGDWEASTFKGTLNDLVPFLNALEKEFPNTNSFDILERRKHIDTILISMDYTSKKQRNRGISAIIQMFNHMYFYKWKESPKSLGLLNKYDKSKVEKSIPRPIPTDIKKQLDKYISDVIMPLLEQNRETPIVSAQIWDMIIMLRYTGRRYADICHLLAKDDNNRECLQYDKSNDPILYIDKELTKNKKTLRVSLAHLKDSKGSNIIENVIWRQLERVNFLPPAPDNLNYLFREVKRNKYGQVITNHNEKVVVDCIRYNAFWRLLKQICKEIPLKCRDNSIYNISPHQFRHTVATEMIDAGISIYAVKEFLGHEDIKTTEVYIRVYQNKIKKELKEKSPKLAIDYSSSTDDKVLYNNKWVKKEINRVVGVFEQGDGCCEHMYNEDSCTHMNCKICLKKKIYPRHIKSVKETIECFETQKNIVESLGLLDKYEEYDNIVRFYTIALEKINKGEVFIASEDFYNENNNYV